MGSYQEGARLNNGVKQRRRCIHSGNQCPTWIGLVNPSMSWQVDCKLIKQIIEAQIRYTGIHLECPKAVAIESIPN